MRRAYLLVYSDVVGMREAIKKLVDSMPEVVTWRYDLPNAFYLISEHDAKTIANTLRAGTGKKGRFIITEVSDDNRWGWLPNESWYLLQNKKLKPK